MTEEERQIIYRGLGAARDLLKDLTAEELYHATGMKRDKCMELLGNVMVGSAMLPPYWSLR